MKELFIGVIILFTTLLNTKAQDCSFMPPDGYTLYTTTDIIYNPPSITGFITQAANLSGSWTTIGTTGSATISFTDEDGRSSTQSISGAGTITIENEVTDINPPNNTSTCTQTYTLAPFVPSVFPNPPLAPSCPLNIVLVIDESESIEANMSIQVVRDAVMKLASKLSDSGSQMAIVEFDTHASNVNINGSSGLQLIDDFFLLGLNSYLNAGYNPTGDPINLVGGTNWEDALAKANNVAGAELVILLTDGRPTFYTTGAGMNGIAGEGLQFDLTALKEAQDAANLIKSSGKHLFVAGIDFPADVQPIREISGNIQYFNGDGLDELAAADYSIVPPSELVSLFSNLASFCPDEIIPTMSEWGVIICGLLLAIFAVVSLKEHQQILTT